MRKDTCKWLRGGFALLLLIIAGCNGNARQKGQEISTTAQRVGKASLDRYDLLADEQLGGHTVRKHVGRTDLELRSRLDREREISAASTWTNLEVAEEIVAEALNAEHSEIERWRERGERRPNLALHYDAGRVIGRSISRGASQSEPCTQAVVVLRPDGHGFLVLTTYPEGR